MVIALDGNVFGELLCCNFFCFLLLHSVLYYQLLATKHTAAGIVAVAWCVGMRFLARFGERPTGSSAKTLCQKRMAAHQLQAESP